MSDVEIEIVEYDPEWPVRFEQEAARMETILGDHVLRVEHIGSTAVPGLAAKPIVDICPVVSDMDEGRRCAELLHESGYYLSDKDRGDEWIELGRVAADDQHFNVHVRPQDSESLQNNLLLREYLRDHPQARDEYARVKRAAAEEHSCDAEEYTRKKSPVIDSILEKARKAGYEPNL
ncbi:GrpB family protein [Halorussus halophilus]|uniref:GrpB family protein n=1 Tax=Halorussus halophilus TaxID=2650975 RepID=UPI001300E9C7|nr:GrpB family protein [Halorussus halophilus]